jgi:hypothetical protein
MLYFLFHTLLPDDADFWWKLVLEEKNHAALIKSGKEYFEPKGKFPHNLLAKSLEDLEDINSRLNYLIKKYEKMLHQGRKRLTLLSRSKTGQVNCIFKNLWIKKQTQQ